MFKNQIMVNVVMSVIQAFILLWGNIMHLCVLKHALNSSVPIKKYKYFSTLIVQKEDYDLRGSTT